MRILQIRFKNLNSLVGEWSIDLTHPAYASNGIFVITGPTGAGKTTILDAVCLALYGRTPRLNKVTKAANEIMSRQTGECFAEVSFETQAGQFRCHWSQHRSRRKAGGELQAPKHEIADVRTGEIFEAKLRGVAEQIETVTGMDFDRFTRSMLLAQGGFAAFLQAAPDERAPILEQITGTEIYSRISMAVHERRAQERKKLDLLSADLAGLQVLDEAQEQQLRSDLDAQALQEGQLTGEADQKRAALAWLDALNRLEFELQSLTREQDGLALRREAFKPEQELLERAERALELAADHAGLVSLRLAQKADENALQGCRQQGEQKQQRLSEAEEANLQAAERLSAARAGLSEAAELFRRVRELDSRLGEKAAPIRSASVALSLAQQSLESLTQAHGRDKDALAQNRTALADTLEQQARYRSDEALVEHLEGIKAQFTRLNELRQTQDKKQEALLAAQQRRDESLKLWEEHNLRLEDYRAHLEKVQQSYLAAQVKEQVLLAGRDGGEWRRDLETAQDHMRRLENLAELAEGLTAGDAMVGEIAFQSEELLRQQQAADRSIEEQIRQQQACEREVERLEVQLQLLNSIRDFEQARTQLQDGCACPLCGATEHPYARGNVPLPDEAHRALNQSRAGLKSLSEAVSRLQIDRARLLKDLEQLETRRLEILDRQQRDKQRIDEGLMALGIAPTGRELRALIGELRQETHKKLSRAEKVVRPLEPLEKELQRLKHSVDIDKDGLHLEQGRVHEAATQKDLAQQTFDRLTEEIHALSKQLEQAQEEALQTLASYGITDLSTATLREIYTDLMGRRTRWQSLAQQRTELEKQVSGLNIQTRQQGDQLARETQEIQRKKDALAALIAERDALALQRRELFGEKKTDEEEQRLTGAVDEATAQLDAARISLGAAREELVSLQSRIEGLSQALQARSEQLITVQTAFNSRLAQGDFICESTYLQACLQESRRKELQQKSRALTEEQASLDVRRHKHSAELELLREQRVTQQSADEISQELHQIQTRLREVQQEIGALSQRLKDNDALRQTQAGKLQVLGAQRKELERWDLLHELIGSADGKKFRNFAQGLTFEMMIGHANRQLQKMTDRYLLVREPSAPLELCVLDNYQAGEIRSTKNLSGGESFIVSLALALGLSQMASKNVRVDSLFLDEGFGTLDEEALETALETLGSLQQEGKLIGVISHVQALKERISTQIQVSPKTGGRSMLSGPGCGVRN